MKESSYEGPLLKYREATETLTHAFLRFSFHPKQKFPSITCTSNVIIDSSYSIIQFFFAFLPSFDKILHWMNLCTLQYGSAFSHFYYQSGFAYFMLHSCYYRKIVCIPFAVILSPKERKKKKFKTRRVTCNFVKRDRSVLKKTS